MLILGKECGFWLQVLPCMATMDRSQKRDGRLNVVRGDTKESYRQDRYAETKSNALNKMLKTVAIKQREEKVYY